MSQEEVGVKLFDLFRSYGKVIGEAQYKRDKVTHVRENNVGERIEVIQTKGNIKVVKLGGVKW